MIEDVKLKHMLNVQDGREFAVISDPIAQSRIALFARWAAADIAFYTPNLAGYIVLKEGSISPVDTPGVKIIDADIVHIFAADQSQEGNTEK